MCSRYWQKAMAAIGRSLEGREPNTLRQDLLGACNPCMLCSGPDCQLCRDCSRGASRRLHLEDSPCHRSRASHETQMHEYLQWVRSAFPDVTLPRDGAAYKAVIDAFRVNFARDSSEYCELLNYYIAHVGSRHTRLEMRPFLESMHLANQALACMQSSLDGDMHQYIAWIIRHRGAVISAGCTRTNAQILRDFLRSASRDSDVYRKVFACFYASRHSNRSEQAMMAFVAVVEAQMCDLPTALDTPRVSLPN